MPLYQQPKNFLFVRMLVCTAIKGVYRGMNTNGVTYCESTPLKILLARFLQKIQ